MRATSLDVSVWNIPDIVDTMSKGYNGKGITNKLTLLKLNG